MKPARAALLIAASLTLGACGQMAPLQHKAGQPLPVKPLLAKATPTAEQLLTPPTYARPERIDELVKRSVPRAPDRFDLPPPDGGAAPTLPETEEPRSSEQVGPATPK